MVAGSIGWSIQILNLGVEIILLKHTGSASGSRHTSTNHKHRRKRHLVGDLLLKVTSFYVSSTCVVCFTPFIFVLFYCILFPPRHFEDRQTEFAVEKVLLNLSNSYNFGSFFLFLGSRHHQAFVLVENFFTWRVWHWRRHRLCQCWWGKYMYVCIITQYWEPLWCHHLYQHVDEIQVTKPGCSRWCHEQLSRISDGVD